MYQNHLHGTIKTYNIRFLFFLNITNPFEIRIVCVSTGLLNKNRYADDINQHLYLH